ncbi:hypothetical protein VFPFJ_00145 [Purpureocillium lilacinum]|uniref:Uncharacterized protein n=1 Tax=Purpureocillium lilacinum TaxID=33203 RepID=A0A179HUI0_PURLI|nr:hypothetical protein VFPFJ_00145 [Purpureocillium lilacinum]OAQ94037.1 hypothetical protein VFPFJ_00145 [Purpureocillium lilacinum]
MPSPCGRRSFGGRGRRPLRPTRATRMSTEIMQSRVPCASNMTLSKAQHSSEALLCVFTCTSRRMDTDAGTPVQRNTGTTAACVEKEWHGGSSVCHVTAGSNASGDPPYVVPAPPMPRALTCRMRL